MARQLEAQQDAELPGHCFPAGKVGWNGTKYGVGGGRTNCCFWSENGAFYGYSHEGILTVDSPQQVRHSISFLRGEEERFWHPCGVRYGWKLRWLDKHLSFLQCFYTYFFNIILGRRIKIENITIPHHG